MSTVTDVLAAAVRSHGDVMCAQSEHVRKVLHTVLKCRSGELGASLYRCADCGHEQLQAHSCRNRNCGRCQAGASYAWLDNQREKLLDIRYAHVVFTLPHSLNDLIKQNQRELYGILFRSVSETLLEFGRRQWGVQLGLSCVLHTWGQSMVRHYHLHCIVTAGGLAEDGIEWRERGCKNWLFPVRALSKVFRGKYMHYLKTECARAKLQYDGGLLSETANCFRSLCKRCYDKSWTVHSKMSFGSPEHVLRYLSLYTHRIAISDRRIVELDEAKQRVRIAYKDYRNGAKRKQMWLSLKVFLSRFCDHVLPTRFVKIRHYGLLANRNLAERLSRIRDLIAMHKSSQLCSGADAQPDRAKADAPEPNDRTHESGCLCRACGSRHVEVIANDAQAIARFLASNEMHDRLKAVQLNST